MRYNKHNSAGRCIMNKRQEQIVEIGERENSLSFSALKACFPDIADITLRRDLAALHAEKRIIRVHGGVKSIKFRAGTDGEIAYRSAVHLDAKIAIARKAADFIRPNATVYVDSGSTCLELCRAFPDVPSLVFTSGLNCAVELCKRKHVKIYHLGGMIAKESMAVTGASALLSLADLHFNIAFVSALGCSADGAFSIGAAGASALKNDVIRRADLSCMLLDSSKFGVQETFSFCRVGQISHLITDTGAAPETVSALEKLGGHIILADQK